TNGTVALHRCEGAGLTLAGSLRNARAVAHAALAFARRRQGDVLIVCAGRGAEPALDDTLCAGVICQEALALAHEGELALADGAHIALTVADAAHDDDARQKVLELSGAARYTRSIGLGRDLDWCAVTNASDAVPCVVGHDSDLLMIERYAEPGQH
ncbi:MAG TPA: 2-phosphosulfolactate phosphatase, partial [Ktedonobacterales bacterium]